MDHFELPGNIPQGTRNETLHKYACSLQAKGYDDSEIWTLVESANSIRCSTPVSDRELRVIITQALAYPKGEKRPARSWEGDGVMDWDDEIEYDGIETEPVKLEPAKELIKYLETLFHPEDYVGYVTSDVFQDSEGKWKPKGGTYTKTAGEIIDELRKHPEDLSYAVESVKAEAGAWIRFNPLDGNGRKDANVTRYAYALVECDEIPVQDQGELYRKFQLPIAALVTSGGKSLHAIVKIDAKDKDEYRERVNYLYNFLTEHGVVLDEANRNPSRLSRMPGITRNGVPQRLIATNIGMKTWGAWQDYAEGIDDDLPEVSAYTDIMWNPPPLAPELISGLLRRGHKMIVTGGSKSGKTWFLIHLGICLSEGIPFMGFDCKKSKVLYINFEVDAPSFYERCRKVYERCELTNEQITAGNLCIWNLRGKAQPMNELTPKLIRKAKQEHYEVIIIDPIYKIMTGDENSAADMGRFCNFFDRVAVECGASMIYAHHHSKGSQGSKNAIDRGSGSGTFGRDPDAFLDLNDLVIPESTRAMYLDEKQMGFELKAVLREFPYMSPKKIIFDGIYHEEDTKGLLIDCYEEGTMEAARSTSGKYKKGQDGFEENFEETYHMLLMENGRGVTIYDMADYYEIEPETVRRRIKKFKLDDRFVIEKSMIVPRH